MIYHCASGDICDECHARSEYKRVQKLLKGADDCTCGRTPIAYFHEGNEAWWVECCDVWYTHRTLKLAIAGWNNIMREEDPQ